MDELSTSRLRWIADRAHYVFWIIWGAGFGAFGLVLVKAVDISGASPSAYLSILTVLMGGAAGLITNRSMDRLTDLRKLRRKQYLARFRMRTLRLALLEFIDFTADMTHDDRIVLAAANISVRDAHRYSVFTGRILARASIPPDFDDLIEADDDIEIVDRCVGVFDTCRNIFNVYNPNKFDVGEARKEMEARVTTSGIRFLNGLCDRLKRAEDHFANRHQ